MFGMVPMCDRAIRWGLVLLIAFTPLAFGTVEAWAQALMEWGIWTLALIGLLVRAWSPAGDRPRLGMTGLEAPLALLRLFGALQVVPLPHAWVGLLSPASARMYETVDVARDIPQSALEAASPEDLALLRTPTAARHPISVNPPETLSRVVQFASFAALFLLIVFWADVGERIVFLLCAVTGIGFIVALFGLVQYLTWNGRIYWFRRVPSTAAFGPFVNHNHFAGYVEMIIPIAVSLALYLFEARRRPAQDDEMHGRLSQAGLALFAAVLLVVSLFFCLSRGGILSATLGGIVFFAFAWRRIASRRLACAVAIGLPLLALALIGWIGADAVLGKVHSYGTIEREASFGMRAEVWQTMVRHIPDVLWTGTGVGTFEDSFAPVTPPGSARRWDRAHNDFLQFLWETGVAGVAIVAFAVLLIVRRYWLPAVRGREHPLDLFRLALAVSLLSIALHSTLDFNLQIGANGFLFALLVALMVALHRAVEGGAGRGPAASAASMEAR